MEEKKKSSHSSVQKAVKNRSDWIGKVRISPNYNNNIASLFFLFKILFIQDCPVGSAI